MTKKTQDQLRRDKRQQRRALALKLRRRLSHRACRHLIASSYLRYASRIAFFSALQRDGEIDLSSALAWAQRRGKRCFLPVLYGPSRPPRLRFCEITAKTRYARDRFGISYPANGRLWRGVDLDLILTPLTVFDAHGGRVGMGGGYYDRAFAGKSQRTKMLGCAFALQQCPRVPQQSWDIKLDGVVTERGLLNIAKR